MKSNRVVSLGRMVAALMIVVIVCGGLFAQGTVNNRGTWNNAAGSAVTVATFNNVKAGAGGGALNNAGTLTVNTTLNNDDNESTINNVYLTNPGTISVSGATSSFNNGAGATTNGTGTSSVIKIGNTLTIGAGSFSTTAGTVEYTKVGNQTIYTGVASGTYGALAIRNGTTANAKTIEGTGSTLTVSGALTIDADKLVVGTNNTLKIGGSGVTTNGTVAFDATTGGGTTVEYTANGGQTVFPTNYVNLSLTGSSGTNTKSVDGTIGVAGALAISANDVLDVINDNDLSFGASADVNNSGLVKASGDVTFAGVITPTLAGSWEYYSANPQTVGAFAYQSLTLSQAGDKTYQTGTTSVSGAYSVTTSGAVDYRTNSTTFNYASASGGTLYAHDYYNLGLTGSGSFGLSTAGLTAGSITVGASATMALTAAATVQVGYVGNDGDMTVNGGLTLADGTTLTLGLVAGPYGTFANNGTGMSNDGSITLYGNNTASYKFTNGASATLANTLNGDISVTNADFDNEGTVTNAGAITVN